jgi:hypothetical protein
MPSKLLQLVNKYSFKILKDAKLINIPENGNYLISSGRLKYLYAKRSAFKVHSDYFEKAIPIAENELHYTTPYELLVAVILFSAMHRCTGLTK